MSEQEKFIEWLATFGNCECFKHESFSDNLEFAWHACAVRKNKEKSELREQLAEANARLSGQTCFVPPELQAELDECKAKLDYQTKQCADRLIGLCKCGLERDELKAKLKELEGQEPALVIDNISKMGVSFVCADGSDLPEVDLFVGAKFYAKPIPPVDVQALHKQVVYLDNEASKNADMNNRQAIRIAELERKLAAFQAADLVVWMALNAEGEAPFAELRYEELNTLLSQAREEGRQEAVPEGWQVVPKEPTSAMRTAGVDYFIENRSDYFTTNEHYRLMLAAAPTPGDKE